MRLRKLLGLAVVGALAAAAVRRFRGKRQSKKRTEMSPIDEEVPGDEPLPEEDVPEDHAG